MVSISPVRVACAEIAYTTQNCALCYMRALICGGCIRYERDPSQFSMYVYCIMNACRSPGIMQRVQAMAMISLQDETCAASRRSHSHDDGPGPSQLTGATGGVAATVALAKHRRSTYNAT